MNWNNLRLHMILYFHVSFKKNRDQWHFYTTNYSTFLLKRDQKTLKQTHFSPTILQKTETKGFKARTSFHSSYFHVFFKKQRPKTLKQTRFSQQLFPRFSIKKRPTTFFLYNSYFHDFLNKTETKDCKTSTPFWEKERGQSSQIKLLFILFTGPWNGSIRDRTIYIHGKVFLFIQSQVQYIQGLVECISIIL